MSSSPPLSSLKFEDFSDEQKYYLNLLTKFSGKTNRVKLLTADDMGKKREDFILEHFYYLTIDEQVGFNTTKRYKNETLRDIQVMLPLTFSISFIGFLIKTSSTKSLFPSVAKSIAIASLLNLCYYEYHSRIYRENLQKYYIIVLKNKRK